MRSDPGFWYGADRLEDQLPNCFGLGISGRRWKSTASIAPQSHNGDGDGEAEGDGNGKERQSLRLMLTEVGCRSA